MFWGLLILGITEQSKFECKVAEAIIGELVQSLSYISLNNDGVVQKIQECGMSWDFVL